jgi:hypothetical protein
MILGRLAAVLGRFRPFAIFSYAHNRVSPHLNVGYQFNGESLLAGNVQTGEKADLPDQFLYSAGFVPSTG